jgi:hypothetical protein
MSFPELSPSDRVLVLEMYADVVATHLDMLRRYAEANMARCDGLARDNLLALPLWPLMRTSLF